MSGEEGGRAARALVADALGIPPVKDTEQRARSGEAVQGLSSLVQQYCRKEVQVIERVVGT